MKDYNWQSVEKIFNEAVLLSTKEQQEYIDTVCGTNNKLKEDILSLLDEFETDDYLTDDSIFSTGLKVLATEVESLLTEPEFSKYRLIKILGRGATGVVFLAFDLQMERHAAIKVFHETLFDDRKNLEKIRREARIASTLVSPNLVHIYEFGETKGRFFLVMEYVEGATLRELITTKELTVKQIVEISIQVAKALEIIHDKGFIHRDIKPENIIVGTRNSVKLLDFGIAKPVDAKTDHFSLNSHTTAGKIIGTSAYMSPEQLRGSRLDQRTDYWSLGILIYEMLNGSRPFQGQTISDVHASILLSEIIIDNKLPGNKVLSSLIIKLLEKDREKRYESATSIIDDLRIIYRGLSSGSKKELYLKRLYSLFNKNKGKSRK